MTFVGSGAFGVVYKAVHKESKQVFAFKDVRHQFDEEERAGLANLFQNEVTVRV